MAFNPPPPEVADRVIQRSDDTEETVRTRLEQFHAHSKAVVTALGGVCELIQADGTRPVDQVAELLLGELNGACFAITQPLCLSSVWFPRTRHARLSSFQTVSSELLTSWVECKLLTCYVAIVSVFEHFRDKDCLLLCLPESCRRPEITSGFRFVRGDPSISTIAGLRQQDEENNVVANKKAKHAKHDKHDKAKTFILYAFHRDELPFLLNFTLDLSTNDELQQGHHGEPVIVKGMGVKGFGLTVRSWTHKCIEILGLGGKKEKKQKTRPRAVTSETGGAVNNISSDSHVTDAGRNTIH